MAAITPEEIEWMECKHKVYMEELARQRQPQTGANIVQPITTATETTAPAKPKRTLVQRWQDDVTLRAEWGHDRERFLRAHTRAAKAPAVRMHGP